MAVQPTLVLRSDDVVGLVPRRERRVHGPVNSKHLEIRRLMVIEVETVVDRQDSKEGVDLKRGGSGSHPYGLVVPMGLLTGSSRKFRGELYLDENFPWVGQSDVETVVTSVRPPEVGVLSDLIPTFNQRLQRRLDLS
jgi:hypothetical protein